MKLCRYDNAMVMVMVILSVMVLSNVSQEENLRLQKQLAKHNTDQYSYVKPNHGFNYEKSMKEMVPSPSPSPMSSEFRAEALRLVAETASRKAESDGFKEGLEFARRRDVLFQTARAIEDVLDRS